MRYASLTAGIIFCCGVAQAERYDIVKDGKLTEHARFVGQFHPGDRQHDDGTFTFGHLYNFLYAGAGFTRPDARIYARLSLGHSNAPQPGERYGAILSVNGGAVYLSQDEEGRFRVDYGMTDFDGENFLSEHAGRPLPIVPAGTPFELEVILKDGGLTYTINGKEACHIPQSPRLQNMQPKETTASQGVDLIVALRPWREPEMKVYDFYVETDGNLVPLPEIQEIFKGVRSFRKEDLEEGTTHLYRIPALAVSKNGTLLAFAEARRDSAADHGNIDTVVRRSEDGGKTWGPEIVVAGDGDNTMGNPCPVVDRDTGRVWLHLCWNGHQPPPGGFKPGYGEDSRRVFVTYSDDDGRTWARAKEITASVKLEHWSWYATGPGHGIQLERGKHKGRLIIPSNHKSEPEGGPRTYHSHIVYSDDHGETWKIGAVTAEGYNESTAVELENGDVMLNSRLHGPGTHDKKYRGVSISGNGGETFARWGYNRDLIDPHCQGSLRRIRWAEDGNPGVIAFSNPAWPWRTHVMVRYSYDDGITWPAGRMIYPWTSAYSDTAVLPDGRVAVLFEKDWWGSVSLAILPAPPALPPAAGEAARR
jgi:sialidase-1